MNLSFKSILFLSLLFISNNLVSQNILWEYEIGGDEQKYIGYSWAEGNQLYFNVNKLSHDYLLSLNLDGKLNGIVYLNECSKNSAILPFKDEKYLTSGLNCYKENGKSYSSKLYSKEGELLKSKPAFGSGSYSSTKNRTGYYFLNKKHGFAYEDINIGHIDWNFNTTKETIPIEPLKKHYKGIGVSGGVKLLSDNTLVFGCSYYEYEDIHRPKTVYGMVVGVKNSKVKWTYPKTENEYYLRKFRTFKNKCGLVRYHEKNCHTLFELIDQYGHLLHSFELKTVPSDYIIQKDKVIFLFRHHIEVYSHDGQQLDIYDQYDQEHRMHQSVIKLLGDNDFLITGFKENSRSLMIRRLSLSGEEISIPTNEIKELSFDEISTEILSLSVYPNPAMIDINFKIEGTDNPDSKFQIQIFSSDGKAIIQKEFNNTQFKLEISDLPSGNYFYKVVGVNSDGEQSAFSGKFIKVE